MLSTTYKTYARIANAMCSIEKFDGLHLQNRQISRIASKIRNVEERKIKIDDIEINYARVGKGDHPVLLLPGALGSIWTDFKPQIENLDIDKLTIVAWDPPGYGKSRPPDRTFPNDFLQRDATWARNLMKTLGYSKFSLVGWSDGGITSLLLASAYPESINKMVIVAANSYLHPDEIKAYEEIKNIDKWSESMKAPKIQIYGEEYFRNTWLNLTDTLYELFKKQDGDLCKQALSKIKCSTLIVHGAKDTLVLPEHPTYLKQKIADSRIYVFENGAHNLHLKYAEEFNKLVTDFLLE